MSTKGVGFIGLGNMGAAIAERFLAAGVPLVVCDPNVGSVAPFEAAGAAVARTPVEVANRARVVFSCLPTPQAAIEVALGAEGVRLGKVVETYIDTATIGMEVAQRIAQGLPSGIGFLDGPVSGGPVGARAGTLTTIVSGSQATFEHAQPYLQIMAKNVFHVGERAGQAQIVKLINNHLSAAARLATFEGMVLGMKAGIDPVVLIDVINAGTGRNHTTSDKIPAALRSGEFAYGSKLSNSIKDETLLHEEAVALGIPLWVAPRLLETLKEAAAAGFKDRDSMFLIQYMGEKAGMDARAIMERGK